MKNKTNILGRLIKDIFLSNPLVFILSIICVLLSSVGIIIAPIMLQEIVNNVVVHILYDMSSLYFQYG